jgi:hypothetical protein|tara:strand:+ start:110 stop:349 length:240 start_codon:yes stop_codon:yes gene_type:complete
MNEDHAGGNFIWGMTLVRRSTRSSIAVALPTSLNSELNYVTMSDMDTDKTFEAINEWAEIEFQGWETVALLPRFDKASK